MTIFTIGHSTRSADEFISLLGEHAIELLADIRTIPKSRHNPQFGQDVLPPTLVDAGIHYRHFEGLGGLRRAQPDSINSGWRNTSFRGYADYMQTEPFVQALDELIACANAQTAAIMCAEAVPWRCHRSLVGDALLIRGIEVVDIMGPGSCRPHKLTPFARVEGTAVTYPPADAV